jgi:hypothetical protein
MSLGVKGLMRGTDYSLKTNQAKLILRKKLMSWKHAVAS